MRKILDLVGNTYGRLTVISRLPPVPNSHDSWWLCKCSCGLTTNVRASSLKMNVTKSCGCFRVEAKLIHGENPGNGRKTKEYRTWDHMIQRCTNTNKPEYKRYWGRGINVCEKWRNDFTAFLADVGRAPSNKHSLDRINNDGNYEPGNCRWATAKEQLNNRSNTVWIEHAGKRMTLTEWSRHLGITTGTLKFRLKKWPVDRVFIPKLSRHPSI